MPIAQLNPASADPFHTKSDLFCRSNGCSGIGRIVCMIPDNNLGTILVRITRGINNKLLI